MSAKNLIKKDTIIIGAGAAGLMCAITASKRGLQVLVLDHANKPGKKILMSGGGRCNFTNINTHPGCYVSHNPHFVKSALARYRPNDFIALVKKHHIPFHEKTLGQLFCDNKSKDILNLLLKECESAKAKIQLNTTIQSIEKTVNGFLLLTNKGKFSCQSLVIATGGLSIPTLGATPFGYQVAKQFGINVFPTRAGLVPFTLHKADKERLSELSGISVNCRVSCNNHVFTEAMLFTHRGLSGPAMLQISSFWQGGDTLHIDFLPDQSLFDLLKIAKSKQANWSLKRFLSGYFSKKQIAIWIDATLLEKKLADLSDQSLKAISSAFHDFKIIPNGTEGYRTAEVTLGGVDCDAISSKTFEAKNTKGLYFIGEVLDVAGWLGGYNFQWAWASGYAAGTEI